MYYKTKNCLKCILKYQLKLKVFLCFCNPNMFYKNSMGMDNPSLLLTIRTNQTFYEHIFVNGILSKNTHKMLLHVYYMLTQRYFV